LRRAAATAVCISSPGAPANHSSGRSAGGLSVLDGQLAIHEDVTHSGTELVGFFVGCVVLDRVRIENDNVGEEIRRTTRAYNAALEGLILRHPEQWFWVHRRWKNLGPRK